jgi:hypothetical protein
MEDMMSKRALDFAFAAVLCGACIYLWFIADSFRGSPRYAQIDTDFWPKIVTGLAAVLTAIIATQNGIGWLRERGGVGGDRFYLDWWRIARMAAMGGLVLVYFVAFNQIGFLISTVAFLWVAAFALPGGAFWTKVVFPPLFTIALTALFSRVLDLPLPRGQGMFYEFSLMFY